MNGYDVHLQTSHQRHIITVVNSNTDTLVIQVKRVYCCKKVRKKPEYLYQQYVSEDLDHFTAVILSVSMSSFCRWPLTNSIGFSMQSWLKGYPIWTDEYIKRTDYFYKQKCTNSIIKSPITLHIAMSCQMTSMCASLSTNVL